MNDAFLISVVDDDESIRQSLEGLLKSLGHEVAVFSTAEQFLHSPAFAACHCLILDVRMPGMSGIDLQRELMDRRRGLPVIFITAHGDEDVVARVIAGGAVDCLRKPFGEDALIGAIDRALKGTGA